MKRMIKKRYLILSIIFLVIIIITTLMILNRKSNVTIAKRDTNTIDTNSIISTNEIMQNIPESNIDNEQIIELETDLKEMAQDKAHETEKAQEITNESSAKEKQTVKTQETQKTQVQEKATTSNECKTQTKETVVINTKEETSKTEISTPTNNDQKVTETETKVNETIENSSNETNISNPNPPIDNIQRISAEQLASETAKYLKDIQTIKPGLTYKNIKRGQVFWPYRTSEIEIAVGGVNFGTVYYYVEVFVEGNQEKFKYYIDWTGE